MSWKPMFLIRKKDFSKTIFKDFIKGKGAEKFVCGEMCFEFQFSDSCESESFIEFCNDHKIECHVFC